MREAKTTREDQKSSRNQVTQATKHTASKRVRGQRITPVHQENHKDWRALQRTVNSNLHSLNSR